ncbi:hypothetical protein Aperf_G00000035431 [Anoplocephala perfoliata]
MQIFGFIIPLLAYFCLCKSDSAEIIGKFELHLKYSNRGHYSRTGWCDIVGQNCDVYFVVCIWSGETTSSLNKCNVAKKTTHVIGSYSNIQTSVELPVSKPIPNSIFMRIEAWDADSTSSDDLIGTFDSARISISSSSDFQSVKLTHSDETIYNTNVRVDALVGFTCSLHYYGPKCETHCKSDFKTFHCGENGERKCLPGWYGDLCDRPDACFLRPCAPYARCSNTDTEEGRICYCNGGSGPECYQVQNPCDPSPCDNGGVCSRAGPHLEQFVCECREPWYGPTCDQRYSACAYERQNRMNTTNSTEEICLNGGVCQDDPNEFAYTCVCPGGWKGPRCDHKDYTAAIVVPIVLIIIIIMVIALLFFVWKRWRRRKDGRPTICVLNREQSTMHGGGPSASEDIGAISNELYGEVYPRGDQVHFLSAEDEYAMVAEKPPAPPIRRSYEGAIRYASLLWDKAPKSTQSEDNEEQLSPKTPPIPPRFDNMQTPLIGSFNEEKEGRQSFLDRPSKNRYERSKDDSLEDLLNPLPVKDVSTHPKSKKNSKQIDQS